MIRHRGIPFESTWQLAVWLVLPAQQSAFVLQDCAPAVVPLPGLQIVPAGSHTPTTWLQRPKVWPAAFTHCTSVD